MPVLGRRSRLPRDLARLYSGSPLSDRLQVSLRWRSCPFEAVAAFAPTAGEQLDLGCGRGILANLLALRSPGRAVRGLDPDSRRIETARATVGERRNVSFAVGKEPAPGTRFAAISLVDVLYLLTEIEWKRLLRSCRDALAPGGILLVKSMARKPRWKAAIDRFQETLSVRAFGWTIGSTIVPPDPDALAAELGALGFRVSSHPIDAGFPHPHLLLVATLPATASPP